MQSADFPEFKTTLQRLKKQWPKKELDDEIVQLYWRALRDQPLAIFRKFVERHEKHGRTYPQPSDLRPKEDKLQSVSGTGDSAFDEGVARSVRNLEELRKRDPEAWRVEVAIRRMSRILATESPGSSMYEAASNELRVLGADNGRWVVG